MEVGVGMGDFSAVILSLCAPREFVAVDTFSLHLIPAFWGKSAAERFGKRTHRQLYEARFEQEIASGRVRVVEADSLAAIAGLADASIDLMYLDADHRYETVAAELSAALPKMKPEGWIVLNDYILTDVAGAHEPYGIPAAAHEFMIRENWEMIYLALDPHMYCDIVLRRAPP